MYLYDTVLILSFIHFRFLLSLGVHFHWLKTMTTLESLETKGKYSSFGDNCF